MDEKAIEFIIRLTNEALLVTVIICGPPILLSMIAGLIISLFQAVTQIQEQTLTFVPKMLIIFGILAATGPTLGGVMLRFTLLCFEGFPKVLF